MCFSSVEHLRRASPPLLPVLYLNGGQPCWVQGVVPDCKGEASCVRLCWAVLGGVEQCASELQSVELCSDAVGCVRQRYAGLASVWWISSFRIMHLMRYTVPLTYVHLGYFH